MALGMARTLRCQRAPPPSPGKWPARRPTMRARGSAKLPWTGSGTMRPWARRAYPIRILPVAPMTSILPTRACRPQITDYANFAATFKLDTTAVEDCPRTGGPRCPTGAGAPTCPAGFETRGGTKKGLYTFLDNTFGRHLAEEMAKQYAHPPRLPPLGPAQRRPVHPCALMRHALAPRPQ